MTVARVVPPATIATSADTYLDAEQGEQSSEPREYCRIAYGNTQHLITFGNRDLFVAGAIYTAVASERGELGVTAAGNGKELTLTLPVNHAFVQRYLQQGTPPRFITFTMWCQQSNGSIEQQFVGEITSMSVDDENGRASFRIPSRAGESLLRVVSNVTIGRTCPHVLYDTMCQIPRSLGSTYFSTTVIAVDGRTVRVDLGVSTSNPYRLDWAVNGELYHPTSGERMTVIVQADVSPGTSTITKLTMQAPIVGLAVGDTVEIYAGCDHTLDTCVNKYANRQNFGGFPQLPKANPFIPGTGSEGL
jgi:uncharacterized phage protein (TIGR02218 family)